MKVRAVDSPYKPRPLQRILHECKKRYRICVAHRRFGKSSCCAAEVLHKAMNLEPCDVKHGGKRDFKMNPPLYHFIAPTKEMAMELGFSACSKFLGEYPHIKLKSEQTIEFPHQKYDKVNCRIRFVGAQKIDFQRGQYSDGIVVDEYSEMPAIWKPAVMPLLADFQGWAFFIGTPKGRGPFYRLLQAAQDDEAKDGEVDDDGNTYHSDWGTFIFKASSTGYLPDKELDNQRVQLGEEMYKQEYECDFSAQVSGAVYNKIIGQLEDAGRITDVSHDPHKPVWTSWDFGSAAPCAVWFAQPDEYRGWRFVDYYEMSDHGIHNTLMDIITRVSNSGQTYKYFEQMLPWDAVSKTDMAYRSANVKPFREAIKTGTLTGRIKITDKSSQHEGITAVQAMLPNCWFDKKRCRDGLDKLSMYRFDMDDKLGTYKRSAKEDWASHAADAMRTFGMGIRKKPGHYRGANKQLEEASERPDYDNMTMSEIMGLRKDKDYYRPGLLSGRR